MHYITLMMLPEKKKAVIVGGGPAALATSAMFSIHGMEHYVIYPEQDNPDHRYSAQLGQYRQFSALSGYSRTMLEHMAKFYESYGIKTVPVESVFIFKDEKDYESYRKKFAGNPSVKTKNFEDLPIDRSSDFYQDMDLDETTGEYTKPRFYSKVLVHDEGAFNIDMHSLMERLTELSKKYGTHIHGKAKRISSEMVFTEDETPYQADAVVVAAGPYTGQLVQDNTERLGSYGAHALEHCYDIHGAPTASFKLPENHPLLTHPMNFHIIESGGAMSRFCITENDSIRVSSFDMDREDDIVENLPDEAGARVRELRQEIRQIQERLEYYKNNEHITAKDRRRDREDIEKFEKEIFGITGFKPTVKRMEDMPFDVSPSESFLLRDTVGLFGVNTEPDYETIAPWVSSNIGVPILGHMAGVGQHMRSPGRGFFVMFADDGAGAKHMFGPDMFSNLGGIMFQKTFLETYGKKADQLSGFNYQMSGNLYSATDPANHMHAASRKLGKRLLPHHDLEQEPITMESPRQR